MGIVFDSNVKRVFWYIFAGMRGGPTRVKIVKLLLDKPANMNQIKTSLSMDYKTVQHHIKTLEENRIIVSEQKKYGTAYFPSTLLQQNIEIFKEISEKLKGDGK